MYLGYEEMKDAAEEFLDVNERKASAFWLLSQTIRFNGFATKDELDAIERLIDEDWIAE